MCNMVIADNIFVHMKCKMPSINVRKIYTDSVGIIAEVKTSNINDDQLNIAHYN